MTIQERIEHAKKRKNEAFSKESLCDMNYWIGYLNALKACSEEYHNLEQSRDYWKAKAGKAQKNLRIMRKSNNEQR